MTSKAETRVPQLPCPRRSRTAQRQNGAVSTRGVSCTPPPRPRPPQGLRGRGRALRAARGRGRGGGDAGRGTRGRGHGTDGRSPQVGGAAVLAVGVWALAEQSGYLSVLASSTFAASAHILLGAGALVVVTGFLGFGAIVREDRGCLSTVSAPGPTPRRVGARGREPAPRRPALHPPPQREARPRGAPARPEASGGCVLRWSDPAARRGSGPGERVGCPGTSSGKLARGSGQGSRAGRTAQKPESSSGLGTPAPSFPRARGPGSPHHRPRGPRPARAGGPPGLRGKGQNPPRPSEKPG